MPLSHILLAVIVTMVWGFNFVAIKTGLQDFPPFLFSALRFTLTVIPVIFLIGARDAPWSVIIAVGLVLGVVKFSLLFVGIDIGVPAGIASVVLQCQAFFTVLFAAVLFREMPSSSEWLGIFIAFLGIGLITLTFEEVSVLTGLVLVVLSGATWAVSNLLMKSAGSVNMLRFIIYMSLIPPIPLFILSYNLEGPDVIFGALSKLSIFSVGSLLYVVFPATIFGFTAWGFLLKTYPAAKVAPFSLMVPVFGMVFSSIFLGEDFGVYRLLGVIGVLAGLVIIFSKELMDKVLRR